MQSGRFCGSAVLTPRGAGGPTTSAAPQRLTGCPAGCGDAHECGVGSNVTSTDRTPCTGRCMTVDLETLRHYGEHYGCCPCNVKGAA